MATPRAQRIGIWIIVFAIAAGTIGTYFALVLGQQNDSKAATEQQKEIAEFQKKQAACPNGEVASDKVDPAPTPPTSPVYEKVDQLKTEDITVGTGKEVNAGDCVILFFHGTLASNGKAFEGGDNYAGGIPYRSLSTSFVPGFSQGLVGLKEGGERRIIIPSKEAYGEAAQGEIPANSDLVFVVKLVRIYTQ